MMQQEKYQKAQDDLKKVTDDFSAGLSAGACGAKMDAHRDELLAGFAEAGSDFIPVYGDIKSFQEADSALGYLAAVVGIMPGLGDEAGVLIKGAEKALKAGDLETASKPINNVSGKIESVKALDVCSYKDLKIREVVGDGEEHDHIPSFATIRKAKENLTLHRMILFQWAYQLKLLLVALMSVRLRDNYVRHLPVPMWLALTSILI